jgi:acyl-CoA thioester hydrolase
MRASKCDEMRRFAALCDGKIAISTKRTQKAHTVLVAGNLNRGDSAGMSTKLSVHHREVLQSHTIPIRVRYPEVDSMGYLHHSRFLQYFEMGRVELLRSLGFSYADMEKQGVFFAVVKAEIRFRAPARYDDELLLTTSIVKQTIVRIDHTYELRRDQKLLAEGQTAIACVNREGELVEIPECLRAPR